MQLLSLILWIPLLGALIVVFFFRRDDPRIKYFALGVAILDFLISLLLVPRFNGATAEMQFVEKVAWIPTIGAEYHLGIDGISFFLLLLTIFLTVISVASSFSAIKEREKEYYVFMLILETGMSGVFMALDFFLFYIFWEVTLIPMYFLIGIWGHERRLYAAIKFILYTVFGSVFLLVAILALYFYQHSVTGEYSFNILRMFGLDLPFTYQFYLFWGFFLAFAIKVPMFPFHTWLPDAHTEAPTAGSVILAGVLLKMGTYGFLRFSLPLFPDACRDLAPIMITLALIGIIYGGLVTLAQRDFKRLVAYSSVSHLGFVMLGLFTLNVQGVMGGMMQMINHGISTGGLFLIAGMLYERKHTRMIDAYKGLSKSVPIFAFIFAITALSSMGLPGLNNFIGEFLVVVGAFRAYYLYALLAVIGIVLGAAYLLWTYQRMMLGSEEHSEDHSFPDCSKTEIWYMIPLILLMLWIGLYPKPYLSRIEPSIVHVLSQMNRGVESGISIVGDVTDDR